MPLIDLPEGDYIHHCRAVRPHYGGRTRVLLMRARLLAEYGSVRTLITTYEEAPVYDDVRERLRAQGLLTDAVELVNIFEYYRDADLARHDTVDVAVPSTDGMAAADDKHPDGTVYRTSYTPHGAAHPVLVDFRRRDGTVFLRVRQHNGHGAERFLLDSTDRPVGHWSGRRAWVRDWIEQLVPAPRAAYVVTDRPDFAMDVRALPRRFRHLNELHNPHTSVGGRWDARVRPAYEKLLAGLDRLDGLVLLTHRQRDDLAARYGATNNLFVVPNPVILPPEPDPLPTRAAHRFTIIGRLEQQKRVGHALRALARLRRHVPEASLDIYGDGSQRSALEEHADRLGLSEAVTFHGFDPAARDSLWTSTALLVTSQYEGYPLATLEAMSHGCPVISYDLKYGPRDQITDGTDGFLVAERDITGLADRMLRLTDDPDLRTHMSTAARHTATQHSPDAFAHDWHHVLQAVAAQQPERTRIKSCSLRLERLGFVRRVRVVDRVRGPLRTVRARSGRPIEVAASLGVLARPGESDLETADVTVDAICVTTGEIHTVPATVRREDRRFELATRVHTAELFARDVDDVRVRVMLTWHNSAWQQDLARITTTDGVQRVTAPAG